MDEAVKATHIRLTAYSKHDGRYVVVQRIKMWEKMPKDVLKEYIDLVDAMTEKTEEDNQALTAARNIYNNADATTTDIDAQITALKSLFNVRKVVLNKTEAVIKGTGTVALSATVSPEGVDDASVTWTSSNPSVATVDANGVVTSGAAGTTVIRVTSVANSEVYAECTVTVVPHEVYTGLDSRRTFDGTTGVDLGDEAVAFVQNVNDSGITVKFKTTSSARQDLLTLADENGKYFSIFVEGTGIGYDNQKARTGETQEKATLGKSYHGVDLNDGQWHTVTVVIIDNGADVNTTRYTFYVDDKHQDGWRWSYSEKNNTHRYPALTGEGFVPTKVIIGEGVNGTNKFTGAMKLAKIYNYTCTEVELWKDHGIDGDNEAKTVEVTSRTLANATTVATIAGGGSIAYNETATLVAPAAKGYQFVGWFYKDDIEAGDTSSVLSEDMTYSFVVRTDAVEADSYVALYEPNGSVDLTIKNEANVTVNNVPYTGVTKIPADTEVTIKYTGENFLHWQNASGKIVSTDATYTFTLVNNTTLEAVVKTSETGKAWVEFVNEYEQVLTASTWTTTKQTVNEVETVVLDVFKMIETAPSKLGFTLKGWAFEKTDTTNEVNVFVGEEAVKEAVLGRITAGENYVRLVPVYKKIEVKEEEKNTVIYMNNSEGAKPQEVKAELGATCTVKAADVAVEGQIFSCWTINGKPVSYNENYTFLVTGDITLVAEFVADNTTVEKQSILEITSQYVIGDPAEKVAFVASREIAEGYTLLEHGMLYARDSELTENDFVEGADGVNKFTANGTGTKGAFTLNVKIGNADSIKVRAYAIVKNNTTGEVTTLYSGMSEYPGTDVTQ